MTNFAAQVKQLGARLGSAAQQLDIPAMQVLAQRVVELCISPSKTQIPDAEVLIRRLTGAADRAAEDLTTILHQCVDGETFEACKRTKEVMSAALYLAHAALMVREALRVRKVTAFCFLGLCALAALAVGMGAYFVAMLPFVVLALVLGAHYWWHMRLYETAVSRPVQQAQKALERLDQFEENIRNGWPSELQESNA